MITKTQNKKLLLDCGGDTTTINTSGERIYTLQIVTIYWLWSKIPIWRSVSRVDKTSKEMKAHLEKQRNILLKKIKK